VINLKYSPLAPLILGSFCPHPPAPSPVQELIDQAVRANLDKLLKEMRGSFNDCQMEAIAKIAQKEDGI
jgi:hypothetical protein